MPAWFGALLLACYAPLLNGLVRQWATGEDMGHGFFVPLVAGYTAWRRREELAAVRPSTNIWGLAVVIWGAVQMIVGTLAAQLFLARTALLVSLVGAVWFLGGTRVLRILAFPLFLLMFMFPIPGIVYAQITLPLQLLASRIAETILTGCGIPVLRDGNVLELASQRISVVEACSGIRSLVSLAFLALVYSYFFDPKTWMRWLLLAATVPIAIAANAARVTLMGVIGEYRADLAHGFFHLAEGWVLFAVALALLITFHRTVNRCRQVDILKSGPAVLLSLVLIAQGAAFYGLSRTEAKSLVKPLGGFPAALGPWKIARQGVMQQDIKNVLRADDYLTRDYVNRSAKSRTCLSRTSIRSGPAKRRIRPKTACQDRAGCGPFQIPSRLPSQAAPRRFSSIATWSRRTARRRWSCIGTSRAIAWWRASTRRPPSPPGTRCATTGPIPRWSGSSCRYGRAGADAATHAGVQFVQALFVAAPRVLPRLRWRSDLRRHRRRWRAGRRDRSQGAGRGGRLHATARQERVPARQALRRRHQRARRETISISRRCARRHLDEVDFQGILRIACARGSRLRIERAAVSDDPALRSSINCCCRSRANGSNARPAHWCAKSSVESECAVVTAEVDGQLREYRGRIVIGCDGANSVVARAAGLRSGNVQASYAIDMMEETPYEELNVAARDRMYIYYRIRGQYGYGYIFPKATHLNLGVGFKLDYYLAELRGQHYSYHRAFVDEQKSKRLLEGESARANFRAFPLPISGPLARTYAEPDAHGRRRWRIRERLHRRGYLLCDGERRPRRARGNSSHSLAALRRAPATKLRTGVEARDRTASSRRASPSRNSCWPIRAASTASSAPPAAIPRSLVLLARYATGALSHKQFKRSLFFRALPLYLREKASRLATARRVPA